ncbi:hypothetical protein WUBG_13105, partial [Wuchereria bancrofti]
EYGRPFPFTFIQKRLTRRSIRNDQMFTSHFVQTVAPIRCQKNNKASLVIFDKDGTLICFHSTWVPWAINVAKKISEAINMNVEKEIYSLLGLHEKEQKVKSGLLAEGTMAQIRDAIARFGVICNPPEVLLLLPARKTQLKLGSKRDERKKRTNPHTQFFFIA